MALASRVDLAAYAPAPNLARSRPLFPLIDRIDTVGIEREMILDRRNGGEWSLIGPYGVRGPRTTQRDAVVGAVSLVGAVGGVIRPRQQRHVDVLARDVLDRRVARLTQRHCLPGVGNHAARDG